MSTLSALMNWDSKSKTFKSVVMVLQFAIFVLAVFLAVKDLNLLSHMSTKIWVFLLAALMPELYVVLHGISSSSMGVGFFSGSPIESKLSGGDIKKMMSAASKLVPDVTSPTPDMGDSSSLF
jgi:hypothetical protein